MANNENLIPIPGRLHSVATEGHVSGANEIYDDTLAKDQATINSEVNTALGTGGTVDSKIAAAKAEIIGGASTDYNTLGKVENKLENIEGNIAYIDDSSSSPAVVPSFDPESQTVHVTAQTLSEQQKTQVRENIGLGDVDAKINEAVASEASQRAAAVSSVQNSVNAEATRAQAAEADRYTKSETYSKTEVNNLVTTPNQEYVSVTATSQTTAVTDVLPATGAADTTYRVGNWDGTQYNDSVFSEYAWNGSAYIKLSTKSQIGEVYDISANHADTKYADLSAALGVDGANIPQSLRRGGMSVKFVQSSDNNYIQARLMANTFTTDVTQWQVVDDEPTAGSKNLVESGGIVKYTVERIKAQDLKLKYSFQYDEENNALYVTDSKGYTVLKVDALGLSTTDIKIKYDGELITVAELIYLMNSPLRDNINRISASLQKLLYAFNTDYQFDDAFIVSDSNGNIALKLDSKGIHLVNNIFTNSNEFIVSDVNGNVAFKVDKDGIKFANYSYTNSDEFIVADKLGYVGLKVNKNGVDYPGIVKMSDIPSFSMDESVPDARLSYDINLFIAHGQSNSRNGNYPTPPYDFNDALCFASKTMDCDTDIDGLTEQQLYEYLGNGFTDMNNYKSNLFTMGGCMVKWMEKLQSALHLQTYDSLKYQFIGANTGAVVNIDTLTNPSLAHYNRILRVLSATKHFADNIYKTVALPAIAYIQNEGNGNMTFKHVYDMLWVFGSNINSDIKAITGQGENVVIFLYQTCQGFNQANDAMFQLSLDAGVEDNYELDPTAASYLKSGVELIDRSIFVFSMPFYPYKTHETVDPLHLSWTDGIFNVFGAYFGLDAANIVNLESQKKVLHPISHVVRQINNKHVLEVKFDVPVEPLQFKPYNERFGNNASQTAVDGYEPNYGFKFADSNYSGSSIDMIESVETVRCDTVKFVLSQTPVGKWLFYAYGGSTSGGNLCDSQGNIETFMVGNDKYLMDNWCPMFSYYIN